MTGSTRHKQDLSALWILLSHAFPADILWIDPASKHDCERGNRFRAELTTRQCTSVHLCPYLREELLVVVIALYILAQRPTCERVK